MTRTQNSFLNSVTGLLATLLNVVLNFATRSVFIYYLGQRYLGIEGLFTNILSMLSLAELGFGAAIVYKLYKPIEENDRPRILVLLKLYRRVYFVVGCVVSVLGVCLIPALPRLIKDYDLLAGLGLNAVLIFLLYLFNTASSYWFFAYKSAFVQANQKSYLLTVVGYVITIVSNLCQMLALILFRSFLPYLIVKIFFSVATNLVWAVVCDRRYPFVKEKTADRVSREERKEFVRDCYALFLYRASNVVCNASDNIVISSMLGLEYNGLYAVYLSVKTSIHMLLYSFLNAIQASLGSLYTTGKLEWSRLMFRVVTFTMMMLFGIGAIGIAVLCNDFITIWPGVGPGFIVSSYVRDGVTVATPLALLVAVETFFAGQEYCFGSFRNAMGLFQELRYRPVASILVNLIVSILATRYLGIAGVVVGTISASLTTNMAVDPYVICRKALKQSPRGYYLRLLLYAAVTAAAGLLSWWLCSLIPLGGLPGFLVHGCVCVAVPGAIYTACFFRTTEFQFLLNSAREILSRRTA